MGATSGIGVGNGAATGVGMKGPHNLRNVFVPLAAPHVVVAGTATCATGTVTVTFPKPLAYDHTHYAVMLTDTSNHTAYLGTLTDSSGQFASFVINANGSDVVHYSVVFTGSSVK